MTRRDTPKTCHTRSVTDLKRLVRFALLAMERHDDPERFVRQVRQHAVVERDEPLADRLVELAAAPAHVRHDVVRPGQRRARGVRRGDVARVELEPVAHARLDRLPEERASSL